MITPALPPAVGPNPARTNFFGEAAAAFEIMALYHALTAEEQREFQAYVSGLAAVVYKRMMEKQK